MKKHHLILSWILQTLAAGILFQTLYFKFTGAPESVWIFTQLGAEPWGRIASGVAEMAAGILLLLPRTVHLGALIALGIITGALGAHLTRLGLVVQNDGGLLFGLAVIVWLASAGILALRRPQWRGVFKRRSPPEASTLESSRPLVP